MTALCRVISVSSSSYYAWCKSPAQVINVETLHTESRGSIGARRLSNALRKEDFNVGRAKAKSLTLNAPNQIWAGDISYCCTHEGWLYLPVD